MYSGFLTLRYRCFTYYALETVETIVASKIVGKNVGGGICILYPFFKFYLSHVYKYLKRIYPRHGIVKNILG
jgi:hypothetical protein